MTGRDPSTLSSVQVEVIFKLLCHKFCRELAALRRCCHLPAAFLKNEVLLSQYTPTRAVKPITVSEDTFPSFPWCVTSPGVLVCPALLVRAARLLGAPKPLVMTNRPRVARGHRENVYFDG